MNDEKPIIRHCKNCRWGETCYGYIDCTVKYKTINNSKQRIRALFCRFYKKKEGGRNDR